MDPPANGEHPYQLSFSGAIVMRLRQLQRRASREGRGEEFLRALRSAVERLWNDPTTFGEPLYRLPVLRVQVRCAVIRPLGIDFAVCEDRPLVFIKAVRLLSRSAS
jgi:hypothetical protein